ncbi:Serpin (serine protease inhibitor) [uncultured archaeon]|nr:Serpin (serine protease inhibitor) [uncultured archaeon]
MPKTRNSGPLIACILVIAILSLAAVIAFQKPSAPVLSTTTTTIFLSHHYALAQGENFTITKYSNPSTGYSWNISIDNPSVVEYLGTGGCDPELTWEMQVGAGCNETYNFRTLSPGTAAVLFRYMRPWEANSTVHTYYLTVTVSPANQTFQNASSRSAEQAVSNSINDFALRSYAKMEGNASNIFFSPFSVYAALSMASEGARGSTLAEMQGALDASSPFNATANRLGFASLIEHINANSASSLLVADTIWVEKKFPINPEFVGVLLKYYRAPAQSADFSLNSNAERLRINGWVANMTYGRIQDLLPEGSISYLTRIVLTNAVYFKGDWAQQFNASYTQDAPFFVSPSQSVTAKMMHLPDAENASYYSNGTLSALSLDYKGSDLSMLILLPVASNGLQPLEANLSTSEIASIKSGLVRKQVDVWMPRFSLTQSQELSGTLKSLGMKVPFDSMLANFSGINATAGLYITGVFHKAFINVNETGTEAAAATGVVIGTTAVQFPVQFRADHPFVFFIMDKSTGAILFMGRVENPAVAS